MGDFLELLSNFTLQSATRIYDLRDETRNHFFVAINEMAAKEKQTICAILLTYASQDSFFSIQIDWKTQRQDGNFLTGKEQNACGKREIYDSGFAPAGTCFCFLVEHPLGRAQTGCGWRGHVGGGNSDYADPVLCSTQCIDRKYDPRIQPNAWLGNLYFARCIDRDGFVANPAPDRKTSATFA